MLLFPTRSWLSKSPDSFTVEIPVALNTSLIVTTAAESTPVPSAGLTDVLLSLILSSSVLSVEFVCPSEPIPILPVPIAI